MYACSTTVSVNTKRDLMPCEMQFSLNFSLFRCLRIDSLYIHIGKTDLGLVVQSNVSLTSSLRGQLVKCFTTL